jgi:hypothetical protein
MCEYNEVFRGRTVGDYIAWRKNHPARVDGPFALKPPAGGVRSLERLCSALDLDSQYRYPAIANGPKEHVIGFNNDEFIQLVLDSPEGPHFSSKGVLTSLQHCKIPGGKVRTTFPIQLADFQHSLLWPHKQAEPWRHPPVDPTHTTEQGFSKQYYSFNCDDYFVTVGPSLPKITPLKGGGAQFWVGSIGVLTQGGGEYEGARGVSVYVGSAYLAEWPDAQESRLEKLKKGFDAQIGSYLKYVPYERLRLPRPGLPSLDGSDEE